MRGKSIEVSTDIHTLLVDYVIKNPMVKMRYFVDEAIREKIERDTIGDVVTLRLNELDEKVNIIVAHVSKEAPEIMVKSVISSDSIKSILNRNSNNNRSI